MIVCFACSTSKTEKKVETVEVLSKPYVEQSIKNKGGTTIKSRFNPPSGFDRKNYAENSFEHYLQNLPLLADGTKVLLYNGVLKGYQGAHEAVVDVNVGKRDLQQCADAIMRLRGEYLFAQNNLADLHFNFTNGFNCRFDKWKEGYRVKVNGNKTNWYQSGKAYEGYKSFRDYMTLVFTYAGTLSLSQELKSVDILDIAIGDVLIQGGSPGHAVIVVDMAVNIKGEKMVMLAQSYMPAQQIHVLKNPNNSGLNPWYKIEAGKDVQTPEWYFNYTDLKRFR